MGAKFKYLIGVCECVIDVKYIACECCHFNNYVLKTETLNISY